LNDEKSKKSCDIVEEKKGDVLKDVRNLWNEVTFHKAKGSVYEETSLKAKTLTLKFNSIWNEKNLNLEEIMKNHPRKRSSLSTIGENRGTTSLSSSLTTTPGSSNKTPDSNNKTPKGAHDPFEQALLDFISTKTDSCKRASELTDIDDSSSKKLKEASTVLETNDMISKLLNQKENVINDSKMDEELKDKLIANIEKSISSLL
jgi:hypothetical protein